MYDYHIALHPHPAPGKPLDVRPLIWRERKVSTVCVRPQAIARGRMQMQEAMAIWPG